MTSTGTELHTFLRTRRSIRRFKADPVPDSVIENILATATYAPSAHNRQPWRFVVITDPSIKISLAEAMTVDFARDLAADGVPSEKIQSQVKRSRDRIISAPAAILLCLDMREMDSYPDEKRSRAEWIMATQSVAAAGLQLLLAAHAEGLGGVWACWPLFAQATIQKKPEFTGLLGTPGYVLYRLCRCVPANERKKKAGGHCHQTMSHHGLADTLYFLMDTFKLTIVRMSTSISLYIVKAA